MYRYIYFNKIFQRGYSFKSILSFFYSSEVKKGNSEIVRAQYITAPLLQTIFVFFKRNNLTEMKNITSLLLIVTTLLTISCKESEIKKEEYIRKVKTEEVKPLSPTENKQFSGIIKEAEEVNLPFRVAGPIKKIYVQEGDYIKRGALIAEIDPRDYQLKNRVAEAKYKQVKGEADRVIELYKRKSVASNDYEKAIAGEEMVSAQLKNAKDQLQDTKLYAPFSGYIQKVSYQEGEMVNIGMAIVSIIDISHFEVEIDLPTSMYLIKENFTKFSCALDNIDNESYPLELFATSKKANNNQLYRFYFRLDPKVNPKLSPGMNISVDIEYDTKGSALLSIPLKSIFNRDGKRFVWKYNSTDSTVHKCEITINSSISNGYVGVLSGVKSGDVIVTAGVDMISNGEKVRLTEKPSKTNIGNLL